MPFGDHLAISIGFFTGILPAVALVFETLKEYDPYYKDEHFSILMVIGLIVGVPTALFFYWSLIYLAPINNILVLSVICFFIAIYELLLLTIILSMKRFGGDYDLTYYGVVLSGCLAGVIIMFCVYLFVRSNDLSSQALLSLGLLIPTMPLMYISLGSLLGYGIFKAKFLKYASLFVIIKTIFNGLFLLWFIFFLFSPPEYGWELMAIALIFSIFMYYYSYKRILPDALPPKLKKHRRRSKRKDLKLLE